jgi:DNA-binding transcriptional MerR regulator
MFRIGEFSRIARVSGRLLRYYDSIGLFGPQHTDRATGYRYYTAAQLGLLNRILALKDLGLSLEQIARLVNERISTQEIRGMLTLRKTELERSLGEDAARLRHIESRLRQIDEDGALKDYDVIVKSAEARPYLSVRETFPSMGDAVGRLLEVARAVTVQVPAGARDAMVVVAHSDFEDDSLDLEIGVGLTRGIRKAVTLSDRRKLSLNELPPIDKLATLVRRGKNYESHLAFGALGVWMEANGYQINGPSREVFLDLPLGDPDLAIVEIQFPVTDTS